MSRKRIAIAGFQHETNCFGVTKAGLAEFQMADSWPGLLQGADVIEQTRGMNLPIAGFAAAAEVAGLELHPILWCAAEPSAHVTDHAFETITGMILDGLRCAGPLDGVYLDLHGAMVTESLADGEGAILARVREVVGPDTPIAASLDLHANVSAAMVEQADFLALFRTYPHLDMAGTGVRCLPVMQRLLEGTRFHKSFRQAPYLIPLHAQYTGDGACKMLYDALPPLEAGGVLADIALGFTAADYPGTGPSCVAYAATQAAAEEAADGIIALFEELEPQVETAMLLPLQAAQIAQITGARPIVLADVQDNPGAGGTSDTTGLLQALIGGGVTGVLMGLFHDPEVAQQAHEAGSGRRFRAALGGKSGLPGQQPVAADFEVLALSDGICRYTGEMYGGGVATMGKTAALRLTGTDAQIDLVVTSIRNQCLDLAQFRHIGLEPAGYAVICVKSTVHYRADFGAIAAEVFPVAAPGAFACALEEIPYRNLPAGRRISPVRG